MFISVAASTMITEIRGKEEKRDEQMAKMMINVELLAKHMLVAETKRKNAIG